MPGRDRTGPAGAGSRTGGRMGNCGDMGAQSYSDAPRRGFWGGGGRWHRRAGLGGGMRRSPYYEARVLTTEEELSELKAESGFLQQRLEAVQEWISRIEKK